MLIRFTGLFLITTLWFPAVSAQKPKTAEEVKYVEVLRVRAQKIIDDYLVLDSPEKALSVRDLIVKQYWDLNKVQDSKEARIKQLKNELTGEKFNREKTKVESVAMKRLAKLHRHYIRNLSRLLSDDEVDQVKNGMTYNVYIHTFNGYKDMLPDLTEEQISQIETWLLEAREIAMDQGSSDAKHAVFGKYKGRINNYLSGEGYDLNKASKEWHVRLKKAL